MITMVARSKSPVLCKLDAEIVDSNPTQGMDVFLRLSVLCYPLEIEALCRANPSSGSPSIF
jgi:hypothetical protein